MFADKYKRWLDVSCPVAPYPSVTRSNKQRGVFNQINEASNVLEMGF
jgi:hypothetical protein